jgi:hypothetical protein
MSIVKISSVSLAVLSILGCSSGNTPDRPPPPAKTVFDPLTQQIDRAKDVQKTVDANAEATRKSVDSQEHGDSSP